jgi:hypothetical protein
MDANMPQGPPFLCFKPIGNDEDASASAKSIPCWYQRATSSATGFLPNSRLMHLLYSASVTGTGASAAAAADEAIVSR